MDDLDRDTLKALIDATAEPVLVARVDAGDWPVVYCNPAFESVGGAGSPLGQPFADVLEGLIGREHALEASETVRERQTHSIPVEKGGREYLLVLRPLASRDDRPRCYAAWWRSPASASRDGSGADQALSKARRRIRDLTREDPVTGLMNAAAFRDVLGHDLGVAARERSALALVVFRVNDYDAYLHVFGRHATDSALRRAAQAIRRCLRRASDVAARIDGAAGGCLVVLSHGSDAAAVESFAGRIAGAVRELGIHHPRSTVDRFVTVSFDVSMLDARSDDAGRIVEELAGG